MQPLGLDPEIVVVYPPDLSNPRLALTKEPCEKCADQSITPWGLLATELRRRSMLTDMLATSHTLIHIGVLQEHLIQFLRKGAGLRRDE